MIASEKGQPRRSICGCCIISLALMPLKFAISSPPTKSVLRQVATKRTIFSHGSLRGFTSLRRPIAGLKLLSMKHLHPDLKELKRLKILARFEANSLAGRNVDFGSRARIATDPGLAWL